MGARSAPDTIDTTECRKINMAHLSAEATAPEDQIQSPFPQGQPEDGLKSPGMAAGVGARFKGMFSAVADVAETGLHKARESASGVHVPDVKGAGGGLMTKMKEGITAGVESSKKGITQIVDKVKGNSVFGTDLTSQLSREGGDQTVPRVVIKCTDYLDTKGMDTMLLFVHPAPPGPVDSFKQAFDADDAATDITKCPDPHVIAQLLRLYFVELPEPLIPRAHHHAFFQAEGSDNPEAELAVCFAKLPVANRNVLRHMMVWLFRVAAEAGRHGANVRVLAVAMGPAWMHNNNMQAMIFDMPVIVKVADRLIQRQADILKAVDAAAAAATAAAAAAATATSGEAEPATE